MIIIKVNNKLYEVVDKRTSDEGQVLMYRYVDEHNNILWVLADEVELVVDDTINKNIWHLAGTEKPTLHEKYKDNKHFPFIDILCIIWYDDWNPFLCTLTKDGKFHAIHDGSIWDPENVDYWAYVEDLIPNNLI